MRIAGTSFDFLCENRFLFLIENQVYIYSTGNRTTYHRVVSDAEEAHHLNVSRNAGGTGKLSIAVHTA